MADLHMPILEAHIPSERGASFRFLGPYSSGFVGRLDATQSVQEHTELNP